MMKMKRTDIERKLQEVRAKELREKALSNLLQEFRIEAPACVAAEEPGDLSDLKELPSNTFDFDLLETSRIYHLRHIRQICIDYRLRFLDLTYFKPELPAEARQAMEALGELHGTRLEKLKIVAPSRLFKLEDKDDPLLFVPMGNDYFYLVHKWGNDLHPLRRLLVWPFKSLPNLVLLIFLVSFLATLMIPGGLFSKHDSAAEFWIIYFFMFKCIAAVVLFYGFALGKNFNPAIWNSKYFNA